VDTLAGWAREVVERVAELRKMVEGSESLAAVLEATDRAGGLEGLREQVADAVAVATSLVGDVDYDTFRFMGSISFAAEYAVGIRRAAGALAGTALTRRDGEPRSLARAAMAARELIKGLDDLYYAATNLSRDDAREIGSVLAEADRTLRSSVDLVRGCYSIVTDGRRSAAERLEEVGAKALDVARRLTEKLKNGYRRVGLCLVSRAAQPRRELVAFCEETEGMGRQVVGLVDGGRLHLNLPIDDTLVYCSIEVEGGGLALECEKRFAAERLVETIARAVGRCHIEAGDKVRMACEGADEGTVRKVARVIISNADVR
jgi:hypothetical protein